MEWAILPLKKYSDFTGRARRKEFWMFMLLMIVVSLVASTIDAMLNMSGLVLGVYGPLSLIVLVAFLTPQFAVSVRRLHDTNRSGWWVLLGFVPVATLLLSRTTGIGILNILAVVALVLIYFFVLEGTKGPNQYGPDPKGSQAAAPSAT